MPQISALRSQPSKETFRFLHVSTDEVYGSLAPDESGFRKTVQWYLENRDWWENILSGDYKLQRLGHTP